MHYFHIYIHISPTFSSMSHGGRMVVAWWSHGGRMVAV
jgi:hypothetical protein